MATFFKWRNGYHPKVDAEVAGDELERLREKHGGYLEATDVVEAARSKRHKLHGAFEWDDALAATEHRKSQARTMMAALLEVRVEADQEEKPHRMYEFIRYSEGDETAGAYRRTVEVLSDPEGREQLLTRARREAASWRRRYDDLEELAGIVAAMDEAGIA